MSVVRLEQMGNKVFCGVGASSLVVDEVVGLKPYRIMLVTDDMVFSNHGEFVDRLSSDLGIEVVYIVRHGESAKSIDTVLDLWRELVVNGFTRRSLIIAFGGGVIGDLAGFVASTFMRGILYVNIPTTLLSQADASIGGKNGLDFYGKNMVGTFYLPDLTFIDPRFISTLSAEAFSSGVVEIIKHSIISSPGLLEYILRNIEEVLGRDLYVMERIILESVRVKLDIINRDLYEDGLRMVLNLGHTVGHALESLSNYSISHGEAVAQGMMVSMKIGEALYNFEGTGLVESLFRRLGLRTRIDYSSSDIMMEIMGDKKAWYGKPIFIVPRRIGDVEIVEVDVKLLSEVLGVLCRDMSDDRA
jgi:3-dehydroquinate synthase